MYYIVLIQILTESSIKQRTVAMVTSSGERDFYSRASLVRSD